MCCIHLSECHTENTHAHIFRASADATKNILCTNKKSNWFYFDWKNYGILIYKIKGFSCYTVYQPMIENEDWFHFYLRIDIQLTLYWAHGHGCLLNGNSKHTNKRTEPKRSSKKVPICTFVVHLVHFKILYLNWFSINWFGFYCNFIVAF